MKALLLFECGRGHDCVAVLDAALAEFPNTRALHVLKARVGCAQMHSPHDQLQCVESGNGVEPLLHLASATNDSGGRSFAAEM